VYGLGGLSPYLDEMSNKFDFLLVIISIPTLLQSFNFNLGFLRSLRVIRYSPPADPLPCAISS
jgi:hypothetical protein